MHPSTKILFEEHAHIIGAIQTSGELKKLIGKEDILYGELVLELLRFFRGYADKFHHYKEEEILFPEMSKRSEILAAGVIAEMLDNHSDFRELLAKVEENIIHGNYPKAQEILNHYGEALLNHIAAENEEVFVTAETLFNEDELAHVGFRFVDCDRDLGMEAKQNWLDLLSRIQYRVREL